MPEPQIMPTISRSTIPKIGGLLNEPKMKMEMMPRKGSDLQMNEPTIGTNPALISSIKKEK